MSGELDELSELDQLIESDILEALGEKVDEDSSVEIDGITIEDISDEVNTQDEYNLEALEPEVKQEDNVQTISSTDLSSLLSELLNNKTIEITIKVKD